MDSIFEPIHPTTKRIPVIGDACNSLATAEVFRRNKKRSVLEQINNKLHLKTDVFENKNAAPVTPINISWLPFAAGHYHISPDIRDYVIVSLPALTSDIPNRNMQGFMTKTLFEFDTQYACQRYRTFVGRPLCHEHNNKDLSLAYGVVADAWLIPVPKYRVVKVMLLVLVDRTKCPDIRSIMNNGGSYSMGALAGVFQCSVCGGVLGPGCRRTCTCYQSNYTDLRSYGGIYNGKLHFLMACDPVFAEISAVANPADHTALGEVIQ